MHAYGQAWALTHFLVENHFDKLMLFYRQLGEMPPDLVLSPDLLTKMFYDVFGANSRSSLDSDWRKYMRSLKTDKELILADKK